MVEYKILNAVDTLTFLEKQEICDFLFHSLEEYRDNKEDIMKAINFAVSSFQGQGGFIVVAQHDKKLAGAVVVNKTGMSGYIPENILVYIAVDKAARGKSIGKNLMLKAMDYATGDIALHVEPDNPARKLYEKLGFSYKYLEMRLSRKD